ncbi:MAG TPA: glutathione S-transferase family protein [Chromatiaceae bacterium]|nr:glutathione S-transferase family protein [Chromatiaceae bacterium]HIB84090.1 glutathione S-transferase family protein [Chromatiaceae bacterium]HIN82200.1 glutathione S-transferase family protein [Chromatiales bacterium]HIO13764.1 glutathione S-transferase family protein [Chromatiales bacterium]
MVGAGSCWTKPMHIKLYFAPETRAIRPRWLLEEIGQAYELERIDVFGEQGGSPEYKAINPYGTVPAAEIDGQVMLESGAICHWLADQFSDQHMAPSPDNADRIVYERYMSYAVATLEPPVWLLIVHGALLSDDLRVSEILPWATSRYTYLLSKLEQEFGDGPYLLGDQFGAADIMVGSTLMWRQDLLQGFDLLEEYVGRLKARSAYRRSVL